MDKKPINYEEVIEEYGPMIKGVIRGRLGENPDVDDVHQNICLSIFLSFKKFRGESSIGSWIYPIVHRGIINYLRQKARRRRVDMAAIKIVILDANKSGKDENPAEKDYGSFMLSRRQMEVLALIACGHSNKEIASSLNISIHTVRSHIKVLNKKYKFENRVRMALALNKFFEGGIS